MRDIKILAVLTIVGIFVVMGCVGVGKTCGSGIKAALLVSLLSAGDNHSFDQALRDHGAITEDEVPCIIEAIEGWNSTRRENGAKLIVLVGGDQKVLLETQKKVVLETTDLFVWAKVFDSIIRSTAEANPADLAQKRHDMIRKALSDEDNFIQSVGLKAGILGSYPGIEDEIKKRLDSNDATMLEVALDALPPETAKTELPRLLKMLDDYESGRNYTNYMHRIYMFTPLLLAIIRTEDPNAFQAVRTALEKGYKTYNQTNGTREEFPNFKNSAAVVKPDSSAKSFCYYLIDEESILKPAAIDILTTQVWAAHQKPTVELVRICNQTIENGNLNSVYDPKIKEIPEQTSCERFFHFLDTGENPISSPTRRKVGADALKIGQRWLSEQNQ